MPDWDNTESRESDEDAAWRDLVARFEEPATPAGPVPWPEREDVPGQRPQMLPRPDGARGAEAAPGPPEEAQGPAEPGPQHSRAAGVEGIRGFDDDEVRGAFGADRLPGSSEPDVIQAARRGRRTPAHGNGAHGARARRLRARRAPPRPAQENDDEHYIPPAPPPLPKLDPITKGAWVALFGGPAYLVVATAAGWSIPGIAAFLAVAAFVAGFAILVLRMNDPGPDGPDDGDDGAVV